MEVAGHVFRPVRNSRLRAHTAARGGVVAMQPLAAAGSTVSGDLWAYLAIFVLVAIGWAGVPAIGGAVIAGAAVAASQGSLDIGAVLVASILGTEAGWPGTPSGFAGAAP